MKRLIVCLLALFLTSCALFDDFARVAQTQNTGKETETYAGFSVHKETASMLIACQNGKDTL